MFSHLITLSLGIALGVWIRHEYGKGKNPIHTFKDGFKDFREMLTEDEIKEKEKNSEQGSHCT